MEHLLEKEMEIDKVLIVSFFFVFTCKSEEGGGMVSGLGKSDKKNMNSTKFEKYICIVEVSLRS